MSFKNYEPEFKSCCKCDWFKYDDKENKDYEEKSDKKRDDLTWGYWETCSESYCYKREVKKFKEHKEPECKPEYKPEPKPEYKPEPKPECKCNFCKPYSINISFDPFCCEPHKKENKYN